MYSHFNGEKEKQQEEEEAVKKYLHKLNESTIGERNEKDC